MAHFAGSDDFEMGSANVPGSPPHRRNVVPFFLDATEVTFGEFREVSKDQNINAVPAGSLDLS